MDKKIGVIIDEVSDKNDLDKKKSKTKYINVINNHILKFALNRLLNCTKFVLEHLFATWDNDKNYSYLCNFFAGDQA